MHLFDSYDISSHSGLFFLILSSVKVVFKFQFNSNKKYFTLIFNQKSNLIKLHV